jgi:hypothetical protein
MNLVHEQFESSSKEDIDGVLLAIRHVERRLLDRLEGLDERVANLRRLTSIPFLPEKMERVRKGVTPGRLSTRRIGSKFTTTSEEGVTLL